MYGPTEIGIQQEDQRPYGENARALELQRERRLAEAFGAPARPLAPSGDGLGGGVNPGPPMDPEPESEPERLRGAAWETIGRGGAMLGGAIGQVLRDPGKALGAALRGLNVGQSAFDLFTVHADRLIPGPGQGTLYDRFDQYRRAGLDLDEAANKAMADYGTALQTFAEDEDEHYGVRAIAQGARVLGTAQTISAPAPLPGGATLPFVAGGLAKFGARAAKDAVATVPDIAQKIAADVVGGLGARASENAVAIGTAAGPATALKAEDVFHEIGVNLNKMGVPDEVKNLILRNAETEYDPVLKMSFADQRRGVVTVTEMLQSAAEKVPNLNLETLAATRPGAAMNGETLLAIGMALNKTSANVQGLAEIVSKTGGNDEEKARLIIETVQMNTLQRVFAGGRTEWGRAGVALQQIMGMSKEPRSMYDAAAKFIGGKADAEQFMKSLDALWNRTGITTAQRDRDIFKFVSQIDKPSRFAFIPEIWRNSILSNPITHEINFIGNAMLLATERIATRTVAAGIEAGRAGFGLRKVEREVYFSEIIPAALAGFKGIPEGVAEGLHIFANGMDARDVSKFVESSGRNLRGEAIQLPGIGGKVIGGAINLPTRALAAVDTVFSQMAYKAELNSQAARIAAKEGLGSTARIPKAAATAAGGTPAISAPPITFKQRVADLLANPTDEMMESARKHAELVTLKTPVSPAAQVLLDARRKVPGLQFIIPFVTTPDNLVKLGASYSPIGFLKAIKATGPERALLLGRATVGTAIMGFFANQILQGNVTAGAPRDSRERQMFYAAGKQPYSIKIGKDWIQFRRFEPLATPLVWTAAMYDAWQQGDGQFDKALPAMSLAIGRALLDTTYLSGMSQFVDALQDPERNAERMAASLVTGFIPFSGFLRAITHAGDPYLRDPENLLETIQSNLPAVDVLGLKGSQGIKTQLDITGQPVMRPGSRQGLGAIVNPLSISAAVRNDTLEQLASLRQPDKLGPDGKVIPGDPVLLGFPAEVIRGLGLTSDEAFGLNQEAQQRSIANLSVLFKKPEYQNANEATKRALAAKAINEARTQARAIVAEEAVKEATTPEQVARAAVMRMGALGDIEGPTTRGQRALYVQSLVQRGLMTPSVAKAIDDARVQTSNIPEPTVAEYIKAAPLVKQYAALPPYLTGNPTEWKALEAARKMKARIEAQAQTPAQKDPRVIRALLYKTDPKAAALIEKYDDTRSRDPRRAVILERNPWLRQFIGGLEYEQVK